MKSFFLFLFFLLPGIFVFALKPGSYQEAIDGLKISYVVKGKGPVMLAGHPNSGKIAYQLTLQPLEQYFTMVYYDPRGTGASEAPTSLEAYNLQFLVTELEALRHKLAVDKIWLFGHSDQSSVALAYALVYPQHVSGLILSGTSYAGTVKEMAARRKVTEADRAATSAWFAQVVRDWDYMEAYNTTVDSLGRDLSMAPVKWWCYNEASAQRVIPIAREVSRAGRRKPVDGRYWQADAVEMEAYLNLQKRFKEITARTLILNGKYDTNNPPAYAQQLKDSLPHATLLLLDAAGHFPWVEAPAPFFKALRQWLPS